MSAMLSCCRSDAVNRPAAVFAFVVALAVWAAAAAPSSRRLDAGTPDAGVKCQPACTQSPPSSPPPSPVLPPPPPPPSTPPPPPPSKPVTPACPPPPWSSGLSPPSSSGLSPPSSSGLSPPFTNIPVPPSGNLYPVVPMNSDAGQGAAAAAGLLALVWSGLALLRAFW